jgi:hypothetical protein
MVHLNLKSKEPSEIDDEVDTAKRCVHVAT